MPKIMISSDFLMTKESEQHSNLQWVFDLLNRPLGKGAGVRPAPFVGHDTTAEGQFSRVNFFKLADKPIDPKITHEWFDPNAINTEALSYLGEYLTPGDMIIGYELSKQTRSILSQLKVTYIDVWLHPVRFMDDIMFAMGSNDPEIHKALGNGDMDWNTVELYADRLKIQSYKGWQRTSPILVDNSALFVGQTLNDKSVLEDGRFHSVLDFREEMLKLSEEYTHVYYSRHPYLKSGDEAEIEFVQSLPNASITSLPTYKLITHPRIHCVAGLSSSVLTEARMMGKTVRQFMAGPFNLATGSTSSGYATRMHEIVDPSFWNTVLRAAPGDTFNASRCTPESVTFFDGKDKLRDMLGFYWSYGDIDKTEQIRKENMKKPAKAKASGSTASRQSSGSLNAIKRKIDAAEVVAFDIFDTLLERIIDTPADLFGIMTPKIEKSVPDLSVDFSDIRKRSRKLAEGMARGEEVLLRDRYAAIADKTGMSDDDATALYNSEIEAEMNVLRARWAGKELYQYAHQAGKRIILISDTFFEPKVIHNFLETCGYDQHQKEYLSSDMGTLKATGNIFPEVIKCENIEPSKILMIGDNKHSDGTMAKGWGLEACELPEKGVIASDATPELMRELRSISDPSTRSLTTGLIGHRYTSSAIPMDAGLTKGETSQLGYGVLGPMFAGFSKWILDTTRERGITDIYFLARDGEIAKRCYTAVASDGKPAARATYIYASRRSTRVAALETTEDILRVLDTSFSPISLQELIKSRFGFDVSELPAGVMLQHGFRSAQQIVRPIDDFDSLRNLLGDPSVSNLILESAANEREELLKYYAELGLHKGRNGREIAFVDIGHSGTIQQSLCKLLGLEGTTGLYFSTFEGIEDNLGNNKGFGYFASNIPAEDRSHPYKRNLLMFETAFLNEDRSFVCIKDGHPVFLNSAEDETRFQISRELHQAITEFCEDLSRACHSFGREIILTPEEATAPYLAYLNAPTALDAGIFKGVGFENQYSGRAASWIISEDSSLPAIWKAGAEALQDRSTGAKKAQKRKSAVIQDEPDHLAHRVFSAGVEMFLAKPKRLKFRTKRLRFFNDSKSTLVRMFGAAVYGGPKHD